MENKIYQKNNCLIVKLIYVYKGIEKTPKSKLWRLVNLYCI